MISPRTGDETSEERLGAQVGVVLLEVLLAGGDELDGDELVAGGVLAAEQAVFVCVQTQRTHASRNG